uniref:Alpha-2B adrenergic receptor-like n=1 Tax=Petromyzon marinus TaxID=7757 RepID=A0AAJ7XFR3_PETMA|nr:alpha-2B adrenergic receptor-like [Petromyzon marinus]
MSEGVSPQRLRTMNTSSSSSPWSDTPPASITSAAHTATVSLVLASIALTTALANGLVIAAVAATPKLRHPANYLICSLAVADLLVALLVMPPGAAAAATGSWPLGPAACAVWTSADVTCCTASILSLCAIALDRYCAIARAVRYAPRRTPRRAAAMIAAVWVTSILVSMPLALATVGTAGGGGGGGGDAQPGGAQTDAAAAAAEAAWTGAVRAHGRVEGHAKLARHGAPTAPTDDAQESGGTLGSDGGGDAPRVQITRGGGGDGGVGGGVGAQTERRSAVPPDPVSTQSDTRAGGQADTPPAHHTTTATTAATTATRAPQPGAERDATARRRCAARHAHVLYAVVCTVGAFYAPMALLLVLYCGIYRAARSHFRRGLRGSRVLCGAAPNGGVVATGVSLAGVGAGVPRQGEAQGQDGHGRGRGQGRHQRLQGDEDDNEDDEEDDCRGGGGGDERARCEEMERVVAPAAGGQMEEGVVKRDEAASVAVDSQVPVAGIRVPETQCQVAQTAVQGPWMGSPLHRSQEARRSESDSDCRAPVALPRPQVSPPGSQDPRAGPQAFNSDAPSPRRGSQASKHGFQIRQTQPRLSEAAATVNSAPPLVATERPSLPSQRAQPGGPQGPETHLLRASQASPRNPQSKSHAPHNTQPAQPPVNSAREAAAAASTRPHHCRSLSASLWAPQAARGGGTTRPRLRRISESRERRAAKTLGLILGAFTLCWLPFFVRELVVNVCEACAPPEALSELISWLGYANSLVNPLIYTTLNEDFRAAFKRMVGGGRGRWPGSPGSRRGVL